MVTHEHPLDYYLNRLINAVERLANEVNVLIPIVNNANTNRSQEAEALGERLDNLFDILENAEALQ